MTITKAPLKQRERDREKRLANLFFPIYRRWGDLGGLGRIPMCVHLSGAGAVVLPQFHNIFNAFRIIYILLRVWKMVLVLVLVCVYIIVFGFVLVGWDGSDFPPLHLFRSVIKRVIYTSYTHHACMMYAFV